MSQKGGGGELSKTLKVIERLAVARECEKIAKEQLIHALQVPRGVEIGETAKMKEWENKKLPLHTN